MKYCVEISEEQLRIISVAVDEYIEAGAWGSLNP